MSLTCRVFAIATSYVGGGDVIDGMAYSGCDLLCVADRPVPISLLLAYGVSGMVAYSASGMVFSRIPSPRILEIESANATFHVRDHNAHICIVTHARIAAIAALRAPGTLGRRRTIVSKSSFIDDDEERKARKEKRYVRNMEVPD